MQYFLTTTTTTTVCVIIISAVEETFAAVNNFATTDELTTTLSCITPGYLYGLTSIMWWTGLPWLRIAMVLHLYRTATPLHYHNIITLSTLWQVKQYTMTSSTQQHLTHSTDHCVGVLCRYNTAKLSYHHRMLPSSVEV